MIVVRVELHSAITNKVTDLGTVVIDNLGTGTKARGDYRARAYRKGTIKRFLGYVQPAPLWQMVRQAKANREGQVADHPRLSVPVWSLVRKSLESMGY